MVLRSRNLRVIFSHTFIYMCWDSLTPVNCEIFHSQGGRLRAVHLDFARGSDVCGSMASMSIGFIFALQGGFFIYLNVETYLLLTQATGELSLWEVVF